MDIDKLDFPACYIDSDEASGKGQKYYKRITYGILALLLISTLYSGVSNLLCINSDIPNKIKALILCFTALGSTFMVFFKPEKNWYIGRAVSESIKTLTWRFMMKSEPFSQAVEQDNINILSNRFEEIIKEANKEGFIPNITSPHSDVVTQKMKAVRSLDYLERKDIYSKNRIKDQISWYKKESLKNKRLSLSYGITLIVFQIIAAVYLYFFSDYLELLKLDEIMIFLATATISILELNKHKDLAQSYALTNTELTFISTRFGAIQNDDELSEFVFEAEQAISREHTMWLARRGASDYLKNANR